MKRENKFRAKKINSNDWVYGNLLERFGMTLIHYVKNGLVVYEEVYKDTIGQFINEKDENGIDIYEDDYIKIHKDDKYKGGGFGRTPEKIPIYRNYKVKYNQKNIGFEYECLGKTPRHLETGTNKKKIVGNIHDNKDFNNL